MAVMVKDKTTGKLDKLARMVQKGFDEADKRFDETTYEFKRVHDRIDKFQDEVNYRFDKIEGIILADFRERLEKVEEAIYGPRKK